MPVGVAEVQRLADEVVREARERDLVAGAVDEPAREVGALGQQQREVEEAGEAAGRPGAAALVQDEQVLAARAERGAVVVAAIRPQADRVLVVVERAGQRGDREVDGAHAGGGGNLLHRGDPLPYVE